MKGILRKLAVMLVTVLVVSFLVFLAFDVIPGDPAQAKLGTQATPEAVEALREEMGLNRPFLVRYGEWVSGLARGDLGTSYSYSMSVSQMIGEKIPITLTMMGFSFLMMVVFSVLLGIYTARHAGGWLDRIILIVNQIVMAGPPFFSGILISLVLGLILKWFTPGGYISWKENMGGFLWYMVFPSVAIALPKCAMAVKLLRSSLLEELKKEYIRTALSRGNSMRSALYFHALKNAMMPVLTFWGMALADMLAGSIIVEQVFSIPGIGRILLTSISNRDYPVVEAIIVLIAVWVVLINTLVDVIYRVIDPRIQE